MVDVEKELGPLFEELNNQKKLSEEEYLKIQQRLKAEYDEFKELADNKIFPVMREYQVYLQKKAIFTDITREPKEGKELLGPPSIIFSVVDVKMTSRNLIYPNVKFSLIEGNINVTTEGKKNLSDEYTKDQINQELVVSKLTNLVKSCLNA